MTRNRNHPWPESFSTYDGLALMLIDMQKDFAAECSEEVSKMLYTKQARVINELCIENYVPLINVVYSGFGGMHHDLRNLIAEAPIVQHYRKDTTGAMSKRSRLHSFLDDKRIHTLFVMGLYASACVIETAFGALKKDLKVMTAFDVIADPSYSNIDIHDVYRNKNILCYNSSDEFLGNLDIIFGKNHQ